MPPISLIIGDLSSRSPWYEVPPTGIHRSIKRLLAKTIQSYYQKGVIRIPDCSPSGKMTLLTVWNSINYAPLSPLQKQAI